VVGRLIVACCSTLALAAGIGGGAQAAVPQPGAIFGFGLGQEGELGPTASPATNATPLAVTLPGSVGQVVSVTTGLEFSMALTSSGQLYGFGQNNFGQTGSSEKAKQPTPTAVGLAGASGQITAVVAGGQATLVTTAGGQLFSFGANFDGQLGRAGGASEQVTLPGAVGTPTAMAEGVAHGLVVTSSGQLYSFGDNGFGELGDNRPKAPNATPVAVALPGAIGGAVAVAAGGEHSLVLTASGQLYAFGLNNDGQLGTGEGFGNESHPVPKLVVMPPSAGPVTQIAAGKEHSLALTATGQLYAWGASSEGELGAEYGLPQDTPQPVTLPAQTGPIVKIGTGAESSLALTASGQLYTFGSNQHGQLGRAGNAGTEEENPIPTPVVLPEGATVDTLGSGCCARHTLAVIADLSVTTTTLPGGLAGAPYSAKANASGGTPPYSWSAAGFPAGLAIDRASGLLSGAPTVAGGFGPTVTVSDAFGITASSPTLPLIVSPAGGGASGGGVPGGGVPGGGGKASPETLRSNPIIDLRVSGKAGKIGAILKHGFTVSFTAPGKGVLTIQWFFVPKGAHVAKARPVLIASGHQSFSAAGKKNLTVKLTAGGHRLLKESKRFKLTAEGTFTPAGARAVSVTKALTLTR
jgi:alpha-tubulin suppressor-like RCC1 family protein